MGNCKFSENNLGWVTELEYGRAGIWLLVYLPIKPLLFSLYSNQQKLHSHLLGYQLYDKFDKVHFFRSLYFCMWVL